MENPGFTVSGTVSHSSDSVGIVVVGLARGGTSAIAASLQALGIHLGNRFHPPLYEDLELAAAYRAGDWKALSALVRGYEAAHAVFAWKLPGIHRHLRRIDRCFRNPRYIFVYRDVLAIAGRRQLVADADEVATMLRCLTEYEQMLSFIRRYDPYALHVSYEKALADPQAYAAKLAEFCGIDASEQTLRAAAGSIVPSPAAYLAWCAFHHQETRLKERGLAGVIDRASTRSVEGWARRLGGTEPVPVEIYINGEYDGETVADASGFAYPFDRGQARVNDRVSVRIREAGEDLANSPVTLDS